MEPNVGTKMTNIEIASAIRSQISNNTFMCVGATEFAVIECGLRFRARINGTQRQWIEVTLNGCDLYDVRQLRQIMRGSCQGKVVVEFEAHDVYCDALDETVYRIGSTVSASNEFLSTYGISKVV